MNIDWDEMTEDDVVGASRLDQFEWKALFDSYACTECGRCQDQCPAYNTGKDLTPKGCKSTYEWAGEGQSHHASRRSRRRRRHATICA